MLPESELKGQANLLIMPNIDAANVTFHMMKVLCDGITVGPLLLGSTKPAHIMIPSVTSRGIVNAAAYAAIGAQILDKGFRAKAKNKVTKLRRKRA
jgi:malate dehydrogenase (oxaloacetate-decarboxylating)(NADP+)